MLPARWLLHEWLQHPSQLVWQWTREDETQRANARGRGRGGGERERRDRIQNTGGLKEDKNKRKKVIKITRRLLLSYDSQKHLAGGSGDHFWVTVKACLNSQKSLVRLPSHFYCLNSPVMSMVSSSVSFNRRLTTGSFCLVSDLFARTTATWETHNTTLSDGKGAARVRTRTPAAVSRLEIICCVTLRSQHFPSFLLMFSPLLQCFIPGHSKTTISHINILLMSLLLLLKILSPNQIHQLAPHAPPPLPPLLLSVEPPKLDLLSDSLSSSSSSSSSSSPLCTHSPSLLSLHQGRLICALSFLCVLASFIQLAPSPRSEWLLSPLWSLSVLSPSPLF